MRAGVLFPHPLAVQLSGLLVSVWPRRPMDFQTQHQPKLLSGLLEQNGNSVAEVLRLAHSFLSLLLSQASLPNLIF